MNVEEIIKRECPRYVKKEMIRHGKRVWAIIDTHNSYPENYPVSCYAVGDNSIDIALNRLNSDYEQQLRNHFEEIQ